MKFTVASAVAAVAALSASTLAAPAQAARRDVGPSGTLNSPQGGTLITGTELGQGGIWVDYTPVNINYGDTYAYTYGIAASLESLDGKTTYLLSNGEATNPTSQKIQAYLKTPKGACGDFRLVVTETQYYRGQVLDFRSAAPTIKIDCAVTP